MWLSYPQKNCVLRVIPTHWHSIWHICWHSIWHSIWHFVWQIFWHSIWHFILHITYIQCLSIWHSIWHLSDIYSDILSGMLLAFYLTFYMPGSMRPPLHSELAIGFGGWQRSRRGKIRQGERRKRGKECRSEWGRKPGTPLSKSKDPHLAGLLKQMLMYWFIFLISFFYLYIYICIYYTYICSFYCK